VAGSDDHAGVDIGRTWSMTPAAATTTEFLARYIHDRIAEYARDGKLGRPPSEIDALRVTLSESHVARGWYEAPLG